MRRVLERLRRRQRAPRPYDADALLRVYRQTAAEIQELRRAA
jgi:hypothetical protein